MQSPEQLSTFPVSLYRWVERPPEHTVLRPNKPSTWHHAGAQRHCVRTVWQISARKCPWWCFFFFLNVHLRSQVHHPPGPSGAHAWGLACGTDTWDKASTGVWHRDKRRDSPLKARLTLDLSLVRLLHLNTEELTMGPEQTAYSECALCVCHTHTPDTEEKGPQSHRVHWAATEGCMKSASSSTPHHVYRHLTLTPHQKRRSRWWQDRRVLIFLDWVDTVLHCRMKRRLSFCLFLTFWVGFKQ